MKLTNFKLTYLAEISVSYKETFHNPNDEHINDMKPKSLRFMSTVDAKLSPGLCTMGRTTRGTSGRALRQLSAGELQLEDGAHFSALSSGRSNIRLIENELFGPQRGGLT